MRINKKKKVRKQLEARIKDYEGMCKRSPTQGVEFKKPGSMSGRK